MQNLAQAPLNSVCPICAMVVDENQPVVVAVLTDDAHGDAVVRMGACGAEHRTMLACRPEAYATAALSNLIMASSSEDA